MYISMNVMSILERPAYPLPATHSPSPSPARSKCSPAHLADAGPGPSPQPYLFPTLPLDSRQQGAEGRVDRIDQANRLRSERDCQMRLLDGKSGVGRDQYKRATSVLVTADDSST